jgi:tRNA threonylcarbamoyladenosine biosynthesis protein TsaE
MAAEALTGARRFLSRDPEGTEALGSALGRALEPGAVLTLDGELGSGKTCFVRGLAHGLGVEGDVQSPTYALMQSYPGRVELFHFDAWMERRERAYLLDGGLEWMHAGGVSVIEWGSRVLECLPRPLFALTFEHRGARERSIEIGVLDREGAGSPAARALERVVRDLAVPTHVEELPASAR